MQLIGNEFFNRQNRRNFKNRKNKNGQRHKGLREGFEETKKCSRGTTKNSGAQRKIEHDDGRLSSTQNKTITFYMGINLSERQIEKSILRFLNLNNIMAWKTKTIGVYDSKKGLYRTPPKDYRRGVADILGIYKGRPLAIEVKSKTGKLSEHQLDFLVEFSARGGIAVVARSIEDVELALSRGNNGNLGAG